MRATGYPVTWKRSRHLLGVLLGLALLAYCIKDLRLADIEELGQRLNVWLVLPAIACAFGFLIMRSLRWRLLIRQQVPVTFLQSLGLFGTGNIFSISFPAGTGQLARLVLFSRKLNLRKTFVFSTIFMEVVFDALTLVIFIIATSALAITIPERLGDYQFETIGWAISGVTLVGVVGLYVMVHNQRRLERLAGHWLRQPAPKLYIGIRKFIRSFARGVELLRSGQHTLMALGASVAARVSQLFAIWFLLEAFGIRLPFAAAAIILVVNTILLMVPITPASVGVFQFAVTTSLAAFAVPRGDSVLFALCLHLVELTPIFAVGLTWLIFNRSRPSDFRPPDDRTIEDELRDEGQDQFGNPIARETR